MQQPFRRRCYRGLPIPRCFKLAAAVIMLGQTSCAQNKAITQDNIRFVPYMGYEEGHSTWGSIGYNPLLKTVNIGVTNHKDNVGLFEYDTRLDTMQLKGFIKDLGHLREFQWQGKIHSKLVFDKEGNGFFSTDGGESREEFLMNHPHGYRGGFMMKWNPVSNTITNLGMSLEYESIKDIELDQISGLVYIVTYPQAHFMVYNEAKNTLRDFGRLASAHVPRILFTDKWGNCYYVDWRQRLVKYERKLDKLVFSDTSLPAFEGTPGIHIITGITAFGKDEKKDIIYLATYGAKILAFKPTEEGIGQIEDLGGLADTGDAEMWRPYCPNLAVGNNGKLYYFVGGHGNFVKKDRTLFFEFDPETKTRKILYEYPISEISEVTGSDVRDEYGNLYFAGRRKHVEGVNDDSKPFLIKFNPEKKVNP